MKVLYISGMYPTPTYPQKGIFCHEQVKALKALGVDVDVIVPMTIYDKEYTTAAWTFEGVSIRYLRFFKLPGTRGFENIGKHLYHALMRTGIDFSSYDVLHADAPLPAGDAVRRIAEKCGVPFVVHGHGLDVFLDVDYKEQKNCRKIVETAKRVYAAADAITGVSLKTLENVKARMPYVAEKCHVVYNGVDTEKFHPEKEKYPHQNNVEIIAVGNLIDLKGHDLSVEAVKRVVAFGKENVRLTIFGRGSNEEKLREQIAQSGMGEYISLVGYVPYEQIAQQLRKSDVFLLPSWYEALGCVYLEAMASGLVTIGCYENGIDEVISSGEDGFLVKPHDVDSIVRTLETIMDFDPADLERMKEKAREKIVGGYTWKHSAKSLYRVYQDIQK